MEAEALNQEIMDEYKKLMKVWYDKFMTLDEDTRTKMLTNWGKFKSDPESDDVKAMKKDITDAFEAGDANKDGLLDEAEYFAFNKHIQDKQIAKYGKTVEHDEATLKGFYVQMNKFTPGTEGVSWADMEHS